MKYGIVFLHGCMHRWWLPDGKEEGKNIRRTNTHSHLNIVTCHICLPCHVYSLTEPLRWTQPLFLASVLWGALTHFADIIFNTFLPDVFKGLVSQTPFQFSSVQLSCPTLCDPMNRSTPGLPVHHQLLEVTQTHVHQVGDAIQQSHPLSSPSPPAPNPSQHQGLLQ